MKLKAALGIIWTHAETLDGSSHTQGRRYVPRALNGGPGWRVWDKCEERYLSNAEVRGIDPHETFLH